MYVKNITASVRVCRRCTAGGENDPKDDALPPDAPSSFKRGSVFASAAAGASSSRDARGAGRRREGAALFRSRKAPTFGAARGDAAGGDAGHAALAARRDERRAGDDAPARADIIVGDARMSASTREPRGIALRAEGNNCQRTSRHQTGGLV